MPEKTAVDKSGASTDAIQSAQADSGADIAMRQSTYLNNMVEQGHRSIKRIVRPMMGFKSLGCVRSLIVAIATMHMIRMGQLECPEGQGLSPGSQFYSLAF